MDGRDLQKRIEELEREKRNLQISISQLRENLSNRLDNLPQTEKNDSECR
jgi:regulator of replication initiation timing